MGWTPKGVDIAMRLAFVDLLFSWPPNGGADVDLLHVVRGLHEAGHEVKLFGVSDDVSWDRGKFDPAALPFPAERLDFTAKSLTHGNVATRVRAAVDVWKPDAVFVCDGFFLKPYVILALAGYRVVSRYYAYEAVCHRDMTHFRDGRPCPNHYLRTPDLCRKCTLERMAPELRREHPLAWTQEYLAARAYAPEYHAVVMASWRQVHAAIVSNPLMRDQLTPYCDSVHILPGGVDIERFPFFAVPPKEVGEKLVILMSGRAEDPLKGANVLREAGERLARERSDFELRVTLPEDTPATAWFRPTGWQSHDEMRALYQASDICVVPSVWDEPFGLVALEAMALGRPVCASRVGGLQNIVIDGETGFLFDRGDAAALAQKLAALLDDAGLRVRMGEAGRRRVEAHYTWPGIIQQHYLPFLETLRA